MTTIITCPLCRRTYTENELGSEEVGQDWGEDTCPVCMDNDKDYIKLKCNHKLCKGCYNEMVTRGRDAQAVPRHRPRGTPAVVIPRLFGATGTRPLLQVPQLSAPPPPQPSVPPHDREGEFVQHPVTRIPMFRRYVWDPVTGDRMLEPFSGGKKRKTKKRKGRNNRKKTRRKKQSRTVRKRKTRRR